MSTNLRLGVSEDILPYTNEQVLAADRKFNKFVINTAQLTMKGLLVGAFASLFFKRRAVMYYSMGFGAGYSIFSNFS